MGKLTLKELSKLLSCLKESSEIVVSPQPGYDSGVHKLDSQHYLVISTDPCIGVPLKWFGWLLIHYSASDVAVFGARPRYTAVNLLAPPETKKTIFHKVMKQACEAAYEIGVDIVTGHTGCYRGLNELTGTSTTYGIVRKDKLITPGGAKTGDLILCSKPMGLETLTNFAIMRRELAEEIFGLKRTRYLVKQVKKQTVVQEAHVLAGIGCVSAMHDATEGGLLAALSEMAYASKIGFKLDYSKIPMLPELGLLKKYFRLSLRQVLSISSTGMLLAAVSSENLDNVLKTLNKNKLEAEIIGVFRKDGCAIEYKGKTISLNRKTDDPYTKIFNS